MPATYLNSRRRSNPASPGRAGIGPAGQNTCAMKKLFPLIAVLATLCATAAQRPLQLIPQPVRAELREGHFAAPGCKVTAEGFASRPEGLIRVASALAAPHGKQPARKTRNTLLLQLDTRAGIPAKGYRLRVAEHEAELTAGDESGIFYGLQTLLQMADADGNIPCAEIEDYPRYGYRGLHLDVCRHFFPVEFVKGYLDRMAAAKLNRFHWHLTDDQGWRIEIKKYPELTTVGSIRKKTMIRKEWDNYDNTPYGGYYTQDEIRDIVAYAADRAITVIPEIDLPGHMLSALTAYPELGCTGGPYEVWGRWGVADDVLCPGQEKTFEFLEDVLDEVVGLFPSELIHIGGDECPKVRWEKCPRCQARIRQLGLRDKDGYTAEHYLQGYVTDRIGKYLAERGRRIIGWDEILEGQAPSDAIVMSWRGSAGGIKAAKLGHDVIMTPNSHFYFDYYQSPDADAEPFGIGGCVTIDKVYSFDPMADLTPGQQAHILGVQANLWTEYIASDDHLEYMLLPRLAALSEVQWCQPGVKDWVRFRDGFRMDRIYSQMGYVFAKHIFGIKGSYAVDPQKGAVVMTLTTQGDVPIHYTLDGSEPTAASPRYTGPVEIGKSARFRATALREGGENASYSREFAFSKSTGRPAVLNTKPNDSYTFEGASLLVDGYHSRPVFTSGAWLGYLDEPLDVTIDMGGEQSYRSVELETLAEKGDWIFPPSSVTVWVSDNGTDFTEVASVAVPEAKAGDADGIGRYRMQFPETSARYLKVVAQNAAAIPAWHPGAGSKGFLFVDEVVVE